MLGRNNSIGNRNMKGTAARPVKEKRGDYLPVLIILPAVLLGVWAMIGGGVSPALWGQQAAALVLCLLIVRPIRRIVQKARPAVMAAVLLLFLTALVKIYTVDIASFNTLHKVIAFLLLGVLFMGGAFAYILTKKFFSSEKK